MIAALDLHVFGDALNVLHAVIDVKHLPAARQLVLDCFADDSVVIFQYISLHFHPVDGRRFDGAHIPYAGQ